MMVSYKIPSMEEFNFTQKETGHNGQTFCHTSGIMSKAEEKQVSTLIYTMGTKTDDILQSFQLSADDKRRYDKVKNKFETYFIKWRNPIYERVKFNSRKQNNTKLQ